VRSDIGIRRVGSLYEILVAGEVVDACPFALVPERIKQIEDKATSSHPTVYDDPDDDVPLCKHNAGVACRLQKCRRCGWQPHISEQRITRRFGPNAVAYLSKPVEGGNINDSGDNGIRQP